MFAGGFDNLSTASAVVDVYDTASATWTTAVLSSPRGMLAATTVGSRALFAGGGSAIGVGGQSTVDIYDDTSGTWSTAQLSFARTSLAATSVGTKALFAGGYWTDVVDIYDDANGTWSTAQLSEVRGGLAATSVGTKALFAGGWTGSPSATVDIYDDANGTWSTWTLSAPRNRLTAVTVGTRAIFAGGGDANGGNSNVVDIYDDASGTWSVATLSETRELLSAAAVGGTAFFAGGFNAVSGLDSATVDAFDGLAWSATTLSTPRWGLAATSLGTLAFFAGGAGSTRVDIFAAAPPLFCDPANAHSSGGSVTLASSSATGPAFHLEATDGPSGEFGYFLVSLGMTEPGTPISNGRFCLTQPVGRYAPAAGGALNSIGSFDAAGVLQNAAGTSSIGSGFDVPLGLPTPPGGTITPGTSYYFQCWFRDGARSNFSNVVQLK
jgi:hypothetical protein